MFCAIISTMKTETIEKTNSSEFAIKAINSLASLKSELSESEDFANKSENPLQGALENLRFFEETVPPEVSEYFALTGKTINFKYRTLRFYGVVPIMYNPQKLPGALGYAFDPIHKPAKLTEGILKRLWNANINRNAVEAFGSLSKEDLVRKLENTILSSIK